LNESNEMNPELIGKIFRIGIVVLNELINQDEVIVSIIKRKITDNDNSIIVDIHEICRISDDDIIGFRKYDKRIK